MRKFVALSATIVALVFASVASSATNGGVVVLGGSNVASAAVHIHNNTTGANGLTYTDGGGSFSFGGLVNGYSYTITAEYRNACTDWTSSGFTFDPAFTSGETIYLNQAQQVC